MASFPYAKDRERGREREREGEREGGREREGWVSLRRKRERASEATSEGV